MTDPTPDWIENTPSTEAIHTEPTRSGGTWTTPFTPLKLFQIGAHLIEQFLAKVVLAVVGVFIPGAGTAFQQLADWATDIADQLADLILQIPILGDLIEWLASLFGIDVGDVGHHGVDFGGIWNNIVQVFINPLGFFANLIGGFIPGFQIPGIDASKIISGFIGDGLLPVINGLISGITGLVPGGFGLTSDVEAAASAQRQVLAAISAAVAKLEAQFADNDPTTILVEEDFEYVATAPDPTKWDIDFSGTFGQQKVDGHQLFWVKPTSAFSSTTSTATMRFIGGSNAESTKDDVTVKVVVGSNGIVQTKAGSPACEIHVLARMNVTMDTFVRLRVLRGSFLLEAVNSGTVTTLFSQSVGSPGVGSIITLQCGDATDHRNFFVTINGTTWLITDPGSVSQVGSSYRWRGMGQRAGEGGTAGPVNRQENAPPVAHWASQNAA